MYRSPDQDINEFNRFSEDMLSKVTKNDNKLFYLMGDFNINLLNHNTHSPRADFIDVLNSFSLYPSITKPTRITSKTTTLIDNIFTNSYSKQTAGVILTDISDHLLIFTSTNLTVYQKDDKGTKVNARDVSDENIRNFKNKLCQVNWDNVCNSTDVDVSYSCFIDKFNLLYNECFPIKSHKKCIRKNKPKSPWITYSLLKSIRRKNLLYRKSIQKKKKVISVNTKITEIS